MIPQSAQYLRLLATFGVIGPVTACVAHVDNLLLDKTIVPSSSACERPYVQPTFQPPQTDSVALDQLLEASGYGSEDNSNWVDLSAGNLCGGSEKELVLIKNSHSAVSILRGPTPAVKRSGNFVSAGRHPWRAVAVGDLNGGYDEFVMVRRVRSQGVADLVVGKVDHRSCRVHDKAYASLSIGGPNNSEWIDVAIGDFDGNGQNEIAMLKQAHSSLVLAHMIPGTTNLQIHRTSDLDTRASYPWKALTTGDLDGDGDDELIAVRRVKDGVGATILVYDWRSNGFTMMASSTFGNDGNSDWDDTTAGDFNGDGRDAIAVVKDRHLSFSVFNFVGGSSLRKVRSRDLHTVSGQPWRGLTAVNWLGDDEGPVREADELIALRKSNGDYITDLLVYGNRFHRAQRESALADTKAFYAHPERAARLVNLMAETHANTYNWFLNQEPASSYAKLVAFLDATSDDKTRPGNGVPDCVDGKQIRVWVTLPKPNRNEGPDVRCPLPTDHPLTPFDDSAYFATQEWSTEDTCDDVYNWASLMGRLAQHYPHLVAFSIDDYSEFIEPNDLMGNPEYVARVNQVLHGSAPWLNFVPIVYYNHLINGQTASPRADLGLQYDSWLFYFRNQKEGASVCRTDPRCRENVPDLNGCKERCLASSYAPGTCAEATLPNAKDEIEDVLALLHGRKLQVGAYATGHSACGQPSPHYVYSLLVEGLGHPGVEGVTAYTTRAIKRSRPAGSVCVAESYYCAVRDAFVP